MEMNFTFTLEYIVYVLLPPPAKDAMKTRQCGYEKAPFLRDLLLLLEAHDGDDAMISLLRTLGLKSLIKSMTWDISLTREKRISGLEEIKVSLMLG